MGSTRAETSSSSFGAVALAGLMRPGARAAGLVVYGVANLIFDTEHLVRVDVAVLHRLPETDTSGRWVPADHATMVALFLAPTNSAGIRADTASLCAEAGIPYLMQIEIVPRLRHAAVTLERLEHGAYTPLAGVVAGETMMIEEPFRLAFDPELLLAP